VKIIYLIRILVRRLKVGVTGDMVKGKVVPVLNELSKHYAIKTYGRMGI
jgi:hypothetical protein